MYKEINSFVLKVWDYYINFFDFFKKNGFIILELFSY